MTIKKAIGAIYLACNYNGSGRYTSDELKEAKKLVVAAAKKQIPKKPVEKFSFDACPRCGRVVNKSQKYCPECGIALDWSDK